MTEANGAKLAARAVYKRALSWTAPSQLSPRCSSELVSFLVAVPSQQFLRSPQILRVCLAVLRVNVVPVGKRLTGEP